MAKLVWDKIGEHFYETGVRNGVLYPIGSTGEYAKGVAWNGLTSVTESPSGADANDQYADDMKYISLRGTETFGGTIEAFTYPEEWEECDGSKSPVKGVSVGQQNRKAFGLAYKTVLGNDVDYNEHGYKLHLIYGATASPSEKQYQVINESPEPSTFSWEYTSTPVAVAKEGYKPTSCLTIKSTGADPTKLKALEDILFGTDEAEPRLPLPDEVITLMTA